MGVVWMVGLVHVIGSRVRLAGTSEAELAVTDEIRLRWKSWIDGYRYAVGSGRPDGLLAIGQEMLRWLDSTGWAAHWLAHPGARELEIVGDSPETADQQRVLALPWELLATGQGFLAADGVQPFVVWRRIGRQCAPVPAEHCDLSVLFMAASPDAAGSGLRISDLDYEAEEAAILAASRPTALNMAVEESGCVEFLRDRLSGEELFEVLHLSCHGTVLKPDEAAPLSRFGAQPGPALVLESAVGAVEFVSPADLAGAWADRVPGLVFLSACRTAEADGSAVESFARALVRAVPAVLGWDGSVYDHDAIAFSSSLYDGLSRFEPPAFAAAVARRELLRKHLADPASGAHWHLARVWVGAGGGGPLCVRTGERRRFARNAGVQAFLDVKNQRVPVASPEEFVGRRRELQQVLRAFRADSAPGVVIHGMGNLGKSSLAARIASRLPDLRTVVIVDDYDPLAVFDRIVAAVPADSRRDVSEKWRQRIAGDDELLADAVEDILDNALRSHPILLVVDDLEQALEIPSPGQQLVPVRQDHGWRSAIVSLIRAFGERGRSRLLFTTRYDFEALDSRGRDLASRLVRVALTPFNARQQDKQLHAALLARRPADATMRAVAALTCDEVTARAMAAARGNPGLQNLLTTRILTGEIDAAVAAIESIEAYVHCEDTAGVTDQVSSNSTVDFFRRMAFERYRQALTDDEAEALRTLLLIGSGAWPAEVDAAALERLPLGEIPVPLSVAQALAARAGVSDPGRAVQRLVSLGLVDSYSDRIGLGGEGVAVNPLARPLVEQLGAQDTVLLAEAAMTHLASAWCHPSSTRWPVDARSLEATRLALLAGDAARSQSAALATVNYLFDNLGTAVAACAALAVSVAALDLALRTGVAPDLILLRRASEIATRIGDAEARRHLNEISQEPGPGEDLGARAGLDATRADDLATRGKVDSAMALLRGASTTFEQIGDTRSRAVTMGKIADILTQQGQVVEALRI
ncbi:AAA ATPase domain-containing protein, partial [Tessaracoccus bendigoensis DSM 12906]